ncbi:MAG: T9SS type A sorting domain-containing protein, partial [candidate division Zixibacteria bacterium]|nr:T9SS type A sorting domain-containing protein [candidate division Zixibacteria bacterium]
QQIYDKNNLCGNRPNPFNAQTTIEFSVAEDGDVELSIYNIAGQKIETLVDRHLSAGEHRVNWSAEGYASGIYFYKLRTANEVMTKRMSLLK